jgi:uncharacterized protein (TIGR02217 family)
MGEFVDQYLPAKVPGLPCVSAPRFKTTIQVNAAGNERRNQEWEHPLQRFVLPEAVARDWSVVQALGKHWRIMRGPFRSWPWRDPLDFASCDLFKPNQVPTTSKTDQALGTGDGFTTTFQLKKRYTVGSETYARTIHLPVLASLALDDNGVLIPGANYSVSRPGGEVTFVTPPLAGHALTWGGLFDCEVRFESDDAFEGILRALHAGGFGELTLIELRPC